MTDVADAESLILDRIRRLPSELVGLDAATGRVLRQTVTAERDQPPFDRVTMDGIAIAFRDWESGIRDFAAIGVQAAGAAALEIMRSGQCVEIMTGAMLPVGADTIIPVERIWRERDVIHVEVTLNVSERQFVHPRGSDRPQGSSLLTSGIRLGPPEIAVLAAAGLTAVEVAVAPRVAVISTGDELVAPGEPVAPQQIRSSNDRAIAAALTRHCGAEVTRALLKDERTQLLARIHELHDANDALILSGGVSMGQFDLVPGVLTELGVELVFHKIEQRPGRPMWFGISAAAKPVFALPGNPVSTLVCLYRYVLPALNRALGLQPAEPEWIKLAEEVVFKPDLTYFLPVTISATSGNDMLAWPRPTNTSGDFVSLANTAGFVELPRGADRYPRHYAARHFRW